MPVPDGSVSANPGAGRATYQVSNLSAPDHHNIANALATNATPPVPATVSFTVQWSGVNSRQNIRNTSDGHAGEFVFGSAQMEWQATVGDLTLTSAPMATSKSAFALLGHERNGVFFPPGS